MDISVQRGPVYRGGPYGMLGVTQCCVADGRKKTPMLPKLHRGLFAWIYAY